MKIIDDKGRLFGKINIIDFFVIMFFVWLCLPGLFYGKKIFKQVKTPEPVVDVVHKNQFDELQNQFNQQIDKYNKLQNKINNFLNEHKRARKYFQ